MTINLKSLLFWRLLIPCVVLLAIAVGLSGFLSVKAFAWMNEANTSHLLRGIVILLVLILFWFSAGGWLFRGYYKKYADSEEKKHDSA